MNRRNPVTEPRSVAAAWGNIALAVVLCAVVVVCTVLLAVRGELETTTAVTDGLALAAVAGLLPRAIAGLRGARRDAGTHR